MYRNILNLIIICILVSSCKSNDSIQGYYSYYPQVTSQCYFKIGQEDISLICLENKEVGWSYPLKQIDGRIVVSLEKQEFRLIPSSSKLVDNISKKEYPKVTNEELLTKLKQIK